MIASIVPVDWSSEPVRLLGFAAYVLIAGAVTVHALLRKGDVRAALGWISLAWLSPIIGGAIYYLFGINRVTRRALRFGRPDGEAGGKPGPAARPDVSAEIAALAAIGERVSGNVLEAGNRLSVLQSGDEAYPQMLAAIDSARHSIALSSYIFRGDAAGRPFISALVAAMDRGVAVRVLIDGVGSGYVLAPALHRLRGAGVRAARFLHSWMPWRMPFLNMRNHKKLLIVDGTVAFTGGLNIGAENLATAAIEDRVEDVHIRVEGPVVAQMMRSFARDWSFTADEALDQDVWWPDLDRRGVVFCRGIGSGPDSDLYKIETVLGAAFAQARERVRIVTPYFLPDQRLLFAVTQAELRGVSVEIVLPQRSDIMFLDWATHAHLRLSRNLLAKIYLSPLPFDHSKLMTVDGQWCLIGSSNWDTRSLRLNFEFDLECYDRTFTQTIDALIDRKISRSAELDRKALRAAPRRIQLRDAAFRLLLPYL